MLPRIKPAQLARIAKDELGETVEIRKKTLKELGNLVDRHVKHKLELAQTEELCDAFLLRFLRVSKFDVGKAFDRVKEYFECRNKYEKLFCGHVRDEDVAIVLRKKIVTVMTRVTQNNKIIVGCNAAPWDPQEFKLEQLIKAVTVLMESFVRLPDFPEIQILGIYVVYDVKGLSWRHLFQCKRSTVETVAKIIYKGLPLRISAVHFVNAGYLSKILFGIAYPFLPNKIRNRVHFHASLQSFHSVVNKEALNGELGGTGSEMTGFEELFR